MIIRHVMLTERLDSVRFTLIMKNIAAKTWFYFFTLTPKPALI
jgi:hypothetical protein